MENKYLSYITDQHLLSCIANLHKAYLKAKNNITKKSFYSNKVDTIKLTFDAKFNAIDEESLIQAEILRQIDKSINNSIGTFHEQILGGTKKQIVIGSKYSQKVVLESIGLEKSTVKNIATAVFSRSQATNFMRYFQGKKMPFFNSIKFYQGQ
jgi:hypothetical protein